jgi:hypothetical protein
MSAVAMAAPSPTVCIEKMKLMREFVGAVSDYHRMQTAQVRAVTNGEGFLFEEEIAEAAARRERAKYAILEHLQNHGC